MAQDPASDLERRLAQAKRQLSESLDRQAATDEVLRVIASSPGEVEPVFEAMLASATRICEAKCGTLLLFERDQLRLVAMHGAPREFEELRRRDPTVPTYVRRLVEKRQIVHVADITAEDPHANSPLVKLARARSFILVPMLKGNELIGAITIYRQDVGLFTEKQVELVQNFAAQAVIAIENTRLLNELRQRTDDLSESLEQQRATSDILRVISGSPTDVQPIFDAIVRSASRLCGSEYAIVTRYDGELLHLAAQHNARPGTADTTAKFFPQVPRRETSIAARAFVDAAAIHVPDIEIEELEPSVREFYRRIRLRALVAVPMIYEGRPIGVVGVSRGTAGPFSDRQIDLLRTFADQAVIAIENVRLFTELQASNRDLSESLQQQTATADVLKVISRSAFDLQTALDTLVESAARLCEAERANIWRPSGEEYRIAAGFALSAEHEEILKRLSIRPGPGTITGRTLLEGKTVHIPDVLADPEYNSPTLSVGANRTMLGVPLIRDGATVGVLAVSRSTVRPFTDKQIELLETFADQAVIAIENTRLFDEVQARTLELFGALQQQTATSEVLQVISSSPGELAPVFQAMLEKATQVCDAKFGNMLLFEDGAFRTVAVHNAPDAFAEARRRNPLLRPYPGTGLGRVVATKQPVQIADAQAEPAYQADPERVAFLRLAGARTFITVPMLKEGELVGAIAIYRQEVRPFTDRQIELVNNFAAQAVIAIENTRLLNELRQRTTDLTEALDQQTATSQVLQVISSSPGELEPVFQAMLTNAVRVCEATFCVLFRYSNNAFHVAATHDVPPGYVEFLGSRAFRPDVEPALAGSPLYRLLLSKEIVQSDDVLLEANPGPAAQYGGARSFIAVPLKKESELVGAFVIYRQEVRPFTDKHIELVTNFAAQAVIAIENTRLLNELRQRTDDLSEALEQQTATSEVLQVISSSPGELKPVFEAMLKNATRICDAKFGLLFRFDGKFFHVAALVDVPPALAEFATEQRPFLPEPGIALDQLLRTKQIIRSADYAAEEFIGPAHRYGGARSLVAVPMFKDSDLVGAI